MRPASDLAAMRLRPLLGAALMTAMMMAVHADSTSVHRFQNGLTWIHRPVTHNRIMAFQLFVPGGSIQETAEKAGLTQLMTATMAKGTTSRSALSLAQEMEMLGASFGLSAQSDSIGAGGQATVDKWAKTFDLFEDVLLNPSFPDIEVEKERDALLNEIHTNDEHIFNVADELLRKGLFGDHPYGRPEEGTEKSVSGLTRDDLVAWHKARLSPGGAVLVTVGKVSYSTLKRRIEKFALAWPLVDSPSVKADPIASLSQSEVVEKKSQFEQSYLMVGHPAPAVDSADYPAMKLMNALLGGGMSSPLFQSVREEGSLAYEVSSFYPSRKEGSAFVVYAGMDPKNLALAEEKVRAVLSDFASRPPTPQELEDAKTYIRGHYLMDHQTNGRIAWYLGWWEFLGKGYAYDALYPGDISKVTADDISAISRAILAHPSITVRVISH